MPNLKMRENRASGKATDASDFPKSCQRCGIAWTMKVSPARKYCAACRRAVDYQFMKRYRADHPRVRTYCRYRPRQIYRKSKLHKIVCATTGQTDHGIS